MEPISIDPEILKNLNSTTSLKNHLQTVFKRKKDTSIQFLRSNINNSEKIDLLKFRTEIIKIFDKNHENEDFHNAITIIVKVFDKDEKSLNTKNIVIKSNNPLRIKSFVEFYYSNYMMLCKDFNFKDDYNNFCYTHEKYPYMYVDTYDEMDLLKNLTRLFLLIFSIKIKLLFDDKYTIFIDKIIPMYS